MDSSLIFSRMILISFIPLSYSSEIYITNHTVPFHCELPVIILSLPCHEEIIMRLMFEN